MLHRRRGSHAGSAHGASLTPAHFVVAKGLSHRPRLAVVAQADGGVARGLVVVAARGLPRSLSSSSLSSQRGSGSTSSPREGSVEPLHDDDNSEVGCVPASSSSRRGLGLSSPREGVGLCARVVGVVSSLSPLPEHTLSVLYHHRCL